MAVVMCYISVDLQEGWGEQFQTEEDREKKEKTDLQNCETYISERKIGK